MTEAVRALIELAKSGTVRDWRLWAKLFGPIVSPEREPLPQEPAGAESLFTPVEEMLVRRAVALLAINDRLAAEVKLLKEQLRAAQGDEPA